MKSIKCCKTKVSLFRNSLRNTYFNSQKFLTLKPVSAKTKILGIETSCDDTGCAVINGAGVILGESLHSQNEIHVRYGGINPCMARDLHRENIERVAQEALEKANIGVKDIDAIAVTVKPGLLISLDIGAKYAKFLAKTNNVPLIPIHHMEAHALVARMFYDVSFPFLVLLISGGHCLLAVVKDVNQFLLLGQSTDNSPGEILDKVARRIKLRNMRMYSKLSGGQAIELAASKSQNPLMFKFPIPLIKNRDCNFSFSGLRDSVQRILYEKETEHNVMGGGIIPEIYDLCAGFQLAVAEHLANKTERAIKFCEHRCLLDGNNKLVVSGGVASNNFIFKSLQYLGNKYNFEVLRPPHKVCTDNGIMIAWNGLEKFRRGLDVKLWIENNEISDNAPLGLNYTEEVRKADISIRITRLKSLLAQS